MCKNLCDIIDTAESKFFSNLKRQSHKGLDTVFFLIQTHFDPRFMS